MFTETVCVCVCVSLCVVVCRCRALCRSWGPVLRSWSCSAVTLTSSWRWRALRASERTRGVNVTSHACGAAQSYLFDCPLCLIMSNRLVLLRELLADVKTLRLAKMVGAAGLSAVHVCVCTCPGHPPPPHVSV